jgi:hypothetical protein
MQKSEAEADWAQEQVDPGPHPKAVLRVGNARFTWLGASVLRLEWAEDGVFEDRASLVAVNRWIEPPAWRSWAEGDWTVMSSQDVELRYRGGTGPFAEDNLLVRVRRDGREVRWCPGAASRGNLGGTVRTLDGAEGRIGLGAGLLSTDGWVWLDDSGTPLLNGEDPPWVEPRRRGVRTDGYLLLHGKRFREALGDWARIGGRVPLPPRFAFGTWWSRYWPYTDAELIRLVEDFGKNGLPLDVLLVDMDWHETFELRWGRGELDAAGQKKGWTGYTWNPAYFPEPEAFLSQMHRRGVRVALNLHPASGVQPWEDRYPEVASALGVDPESGAWLPFRLEDPEFARVYLERLIRPLESQGVDFWWLDWQQWSETEVQGLNPTMWLNHVFFTHMERVGERRPLILHRFGGLGSHRYQVGFSGDVASNWTVLAMEPEFTATAANVLYGYWSHDIGGHEPGPVGWELYVRWLQFGALSPILRTHATRHPDAERRVWAFPPRAAKAMTRAVLLRSSLVPYLYTAGRVAFDTGVSVLRPLYHDWPEQSEAYERRDQYLLGPDLVVAPVTAPLEPDGQAHRTLWLPPGRWIEWDSGVALEGGQVLERSFALDEIPLFVRAGAVLPRAVEGTRAGDSGGPLVVSVFRGADGQGWLYEDSGDDLGYQRGELRWTPMRTRWSPDGSHLDVQVGPATGTFPGAPAARDVRIRVHGVPPPRSVAVGSASVPVMDSEGGATPWRWDGDRMELEVCVADVPADGRLEVGIVLSDLPADLCHGVPGLLRALRESVDVLQSLWPSDAAPDALVHLAQTGRRMTLRPESALEELQSLREALSTVTDLLEELQGDPSVVARARSLLERWTEPNG